MTRKKNVIRAEEATDAMDFSRFKTSDWLKIGGALGMLIFGLFEWGTLDIPGLGSADANAFDFTLTGTIPWLIIVAVGVISFLLAGGMIRRDSAPWDAIILIASVVAALLVVIRLIVGPEIDDVELDRGFGLFISAIACVACAVGAYLAFTEHGGNLARLGDSFKKPGAVSSGMTPPPPPRGGSAPPPPPPPPSR